MTQTVATFLVERYWPGITPASAQAETSRLTAIGSGSRVIETIVAAADEVCFWYVDAPSLADVEAAFAAAAVPIDRISSAEALAPDR